MSKRDLPRPRLRLIVGPWPLVVALTVFAIAPLTYPGFFQGQSGFLAPFRAASVGVAPAWSLDAGTLGAEGTLPYLVAWPFVHFSGSGVVGIRWGYALAFLLAALAAYAWAGRWLGSTCGVLAAVIYTYLPWHLGTVYGRGAYAEAWLWVFWPTILWSVDHAADRSRSGWNQVGLVRQIASLAAGLSALIASFWTLPGLALAFCPLVVAYTTLRFARRRRLLWTTAGLLIAAGASIAIAHRWQAPAPSFSDHLLYPFQLLEAPLGSGQAQLLDAVETSGWSQAAPISFQLGAAAVGLSIVAVALWRESRTDKRREPAGQATGLREAQAGRHAPDPYCPIPTSVFAFWLTSLLIVIVVVLRPAAFLWRLTGWGALVSYPWQLLSLVGLPLAFLGGSAPRFNTRLATLPVWSGLVVLVMLASYAGLAPRFIGVDPGPEPLALFQTEPGASPQIMILDAVIEAPSPLTPTLTAELTWQAAAPVSKDYTIFVHLLDTGAGGEQARIAQQDVRPCSGECPTDAWQPGDIVVSRHRLDVPPGAISGLGSGRLQLAVGLYLWESGDRAIVVGRDDGRVIIDVP